MFYNNENCLVKQINRRKFTLLMHILMKLCNLNLTHRIGKKMTLSLPKYRHMHLINREVGILFCRILSHIISWVSHLLCAKMKRIMMDDGDDGRDSTPGGVRCHHDVTSWLMDHLVTCLVSSHKNCVIYSIIPTICIWLVSSDCWFQLDWWWTSWLW